MGGQTDAITISLRFLKKSVGIKTYSEFHVDSSIELRLPQFVLPFALVSFLPTQ